MQMEDKKLIYDSFKNGDLMALSCSEDKVVEWKIIAEVMQHDVSEKKQYEIETITGKTCEVTGDHSLFIDRKEKIAPLKTAEFNEGDPLVIVLENTCNSDGVKKLTEIPKQKYMYDLSVEDNHNFVLENGILAHNSFRPPSHEKFLQAQTQVFGYIWEDEELYEYLLMAIDDLNAAPPVTGVTLLDMPGRWRTSIILRAASFACFAIAMNWIADEFSVSKDEKVTVKDEEGNEYDLEIEKLYEICYAERLEKIAVEVKGELERSLDELSELDGEKYSMDFYTPDFSGSDNGRYEPVKRSFEKGTLEIRSMVEGESETKWRPIQDVMRHHSIGKKMYRVNTPIGSSVFTEDHSLFLWETKEPVQTKMLEPGYEIVGSDFNSEEFIPTKVISIEEADQEEFSFDLCVPGAENFLLRSGILAHNSYSISGVSLDIDKSSKYESMKNNFIQEWDKARDLIKRSIKIIKGLKQPRYGIGISSGLGPYSRPGVQSRRNFISGFRGGWA